MKTIVWDVDDVLNGLMRCWFEKWWIPVHPDCSLNYEEISENPPCCLLGISEFDYLNSLDDFRMSEIANSMEPIPEIVEWFNENGKHFRHIALTARSIGTVPSAASWVFRHFGKWIRTFHFIPASRPGQDIPNYDKSKKDYFLWRENVDIFVDDNEENIKDAQSLGIKGVLVPQPWNKSNFTIKEALGLLLK